MKVQDLLGEFLYQHKQLTLPTIGNFELDASVNVYETKDGSIPENSIRFTQNNQAQVTDELMNFLVQHSGKMKPLAMSDLESYINNGWQFLNIGKPFTIRGVGSLTKTGNTLYFQQGTPVLEKTEATGGYALKDRSREKEEIKELNFDSEVKKGSSKKVFITLSAIAAMSLIAWAIYLAVNRNNEATTTTPAEQEETTRENTVVDTTTTSVRDSLAITPVPVDSSFQLVLFTFSDTAKANKELKKQLSKRTNVTLVTKDSVLQIVLTVNKPLADSAKVMDSLRSYYLLKPKLVKP